jgi:chorismate synthase
MKPIPTLYKPLNSVDIKTKEAFSASIERSDTCAVPAASIVGEAAAAWIMACAVVEKFGGDSLEELKRNYMGYIKQVSEM